MQFLPVWVPKFIRTACKEALRSYGNHLNHEELVNKIRGLIDLNDFYLIIVSLRADQIRDYFEEIHSSGLKSSCSGPTTKKCSINLISQRYMSIIELKSTEQLLGRRGSQYALLCTNIIEKF